MKKFIAVFLTCILFSLLFTNIVFAHEIPALIVPYQIKINGSIMQLRNKIISINNTTYVPIREVAEILGCEVSWISDKQEVVVEKKRELIPFQMSNLYGFMDNKYSVVVEPIYYYAEKFSEGVALVRKSASMDGQFGFIDETGKEVIPCIYTSAGSFSNGYALVSESNKWETDMNGTCYFINKNGENVFKKEYIAAQPFSDGYAAIMVSGDIRPSPTPLAQEWAYIDTQGNVASPYTYDDATMFVNGYAAVKKDNVWKIIDSSFEYVSKLEFEERIKAVEYLNNKQS